MRHKLVIGPRYNPSVLTVLVQEYANDPTVRVIEDRRTGSKKRDRRQRRYVPEGRDRRRAERRGTYPFRFECAFIDE